MEDYHTHYLGKTDNGNLFWGYETFVYTKPYSEIEAGRWIDFRREYAVLHLFDKDGNLISTQHLSTDSATDQSLTSDKLSEMVSRLGRVVFQDVEIKLFQTIIDGYTFGLIPDEEDETINLEPNSLISFQTPWDGEYYT